MSTEFYDFVIIGAGIQGAGVAQAAAVNGHSVLVLEKSAVAAGTSSRSSKLIHGGLRYLETLQWRLVHECLRERRILLRIAPQLISLQPFFYPVYANAHRRWWQLHAGLMMYAMLGGFHRDNRYRCFHPARWNNPDGLRPQGLQAVFRYYDGVTDDVRLTRAVMDSARQHHAELRVPAEFCHAQRDRQRWRVSYQWAGQRKQCRCQVLINAAGPWVAGVSSNIDSAPPLPAVDLVAGSHVLIPGRLRGGVYYVESPIDRRVVFIIPRGNVTMVGTTEKPFTGSPDAIAAGRDEIQYLLAAFKHYFPDNRVDEAGLRSFAGLRVLPRSDGEAFSRPRDSRIVTDARHHASYAAIVGGKLTAYRATAQKVLRNFRHLSRQKPVDTASIKLP